MKKIILLFAFISSFVYGGNPEDLPDFTAPFSLRSALSGDLLAPDYRHPNWNLKQIVLDEEIRKSDPFDKFNLGAVQFVNTDNPKLCLGIEESGFFGLISCEEDLKNKNFQTLFTIIPTTTAAVQIRSFVLDKNECITTFFNPRLPGGIGIGINLCDVDSFFSVDLRNLMLILPPLIEARTINP
ncbi:toxin [Helicobacter sp. MIT 21-1697]|uniref:toxin n=1 Tax=Helicobacter sp. MIT 21-1697 TaxID=2993733 RepID=UPI00224AAAC2|nr:toxin [Helicobacter sp. MIT 21-1697]MCX2717471.1 toxin [Helicobacter sp. MIT 21-1697]